MLLYGKSTLIRFFCFASLLAADFAQAKSLPLETIKLPKGFSISVYVDNVANARAMALGDKGTLFIGTREEGSVYAVVFNPNNPQLKTIYTIAEDLNMPAGVAFKDGALYVSSVNRILRYDNIEQHLNDPPKPVVINDSFPDDKHHGWKFIAFGPDGWLYVPVGAPCNICLEEDPRYASIMRMKPDGSQLEIFAHGVRNTVGFDWDPDSKELWFTDNGRDRMGEDVPPDEVNHAPKAGMHFGYPFCHGSNVSDPEFGKDKKCESFSPPFIELGAHVAALGMRFYTGTMFPTAYKNKIFIAEHGSWNRDEPIGYRITVADPKSKSYHIFAQGWLQEGDAWGRPADVIIINDGSLLISDDKAGVIYRVIYNADNGVNK